MKHKSTIQIFSFLFFGLIIFLPKTNAAPGDLDTTFSQDGVAKVLLNSTTNGGGRLSSTVIQPDGKIVAAGTIGYGNLQACGIIRYNPDGSLDTSFDGDGKAFVQINAYFSCNDVALQPDGKILVAGSSSHRSIVEFAVARLNADGSPDTSFGNGGNATISILGIEDVGNSVLIQPDGKIVVTGTALVSGVNDDFAAARFNSNGSVDTSFGNNGKVSTPVSNGYDVAHSGAIQADGKIVVVGVVNLNANDYGIVRYNSDGSLDTTFDGDGKLTTSVGDHYDYANTVKVQPDGKLIVAGNSRVGFISNFSLVRYNSDGSLDTSFNGNGKVTTQVYADDAITDLAIQPDGKIVAVGSNSPTDGISIARYNPNGSLDVSFDGDGKLNTDLGEYSVGTAVAIQTDGRIVVGGYGQEGSQQPYGFALLRYNANGSFDTSFDNDGISINGMNFYPTFALATAIQPDGKIVSACYTLVGSNRNFGVIRHNADGSLDTSFGNNGFVTTNFMTGIYNFATAIAVQPDGKIIVAGSFGNAIVLVRYNSNGSFDLSFGNNGVVNTNGSNQYSLNDIKLQPDGKIVAAGSFFNNTDYDFFVLRYTANGVLDSSFNGVGAVITPIGSRNDIAHAVIIQPDGKIVAAGESYNTTSNQFALVRYNADGSLDTSFDGDGKVTTITNPGISSQGIRDIALQPDGKIVATGSSGSGSTSVNYTLARYNPNGSLDTSFDGDGIVVSPVRGTSTSIGIQSDGKIIAAGSLANSSEIGDFVLVRYNPNGSLDNSYGGDGIVAHDMSDGFDDFIGDLELDSNGRAIVVGTAVGIFTVARILGDAAPNVKAPFDFDGDGKTDIGIYRPSGGEWWINRSSTNLTVAAAFGSSTDRIVPADYTGDGKADIAFFRPAEGFWYILRSEDFTYYGFPFGVSSDVPVAADFDGDGKADPTVFRRSNSGWYIQKSTGGIETLTFGLNMDSPVIADYDGDGKADIAITRINNGAREWWIRRSSNGQVFSVIFGDSADQAVQGDYTGDGKADIAFFRPSNGFWYILRSEQDNSYYGFPFGTNGDRPTPGDYDGDGKMDAAVFRQSNSGWYQLRSTQGFTAVTFGLSTDVPVQTAFIP